MTDIAKPQLQLLSDEQCARLHAGALRILQEVGLRITTPEARELLAGVGAELVDDEDLMTIPAKAVEDALSSAPSQVTIWNREGEEALHLGDGSGPYFAAGVTNLQFIPPGARDPRDFTLDDFAAIATLADALPNIDYIATPGVVRPNKDVHVDVMNQNETFQLMTHSRLPLLVLIPEAFALQDVFEMAAVIRGGRAAFEAKPFVSPYLNPVSPLLYNPETIDKLFMAVDWHTPVVCQAAPQLGGSSPVTIAGSITQAAAESLTGLVLSQLRRPGAAFITGVVPFEMEMRTGNVIAAGPDMSLFHMAYGQLARWWGLPALGVGGGGDAKIVDEQAVMELAYYMGTMFWSGMDMTFDVGCLDCGLAFSPELLTLGDEMISIYRGMFSGFDVGEEALAVDVVKEVGAGGFFLGNQHTLDRFRDLWSPSLLAWEPRNMWEERGGTTLRERAIEKVASILDSHEVPALSDEVIAGMRAVIDARAALIEPEED